MDIANQLQELLAEDHRQIKSALEKYVQEEFSTAINMHFSEIASYLERFRGDLLDSKRDQELAGDRLERLQAAMIMLLELAVNHRANVQKAESELFSGKTTEAVPLQPSMLQISSGSFAM